MKKSNYLRRNRGEKKCAKYKKPQLENYGTLGDYLDALAVFEELISKEGNRQ